MYQKVLKGKSRRKKQVPVFLLVLVLLLVLLCMSFLIGSFVIELDAGNSFIGNSSPISHAGRRRKRNDRPSHRPAGIHLRDRPSLSTPLGEGSGFQNCSCISAGRLCCRRNIYRTHKMGYELVQKLYSGLSEVTQASLPEALSSSFFVIPTKDTRNIVVVRNMDDALVSGYLYHKAGHECWLNEDGLQSSLVGRRRKKYVGWLTSHKWEEKLQPGTYRWKPSKDRNLCQYLLEESEEDGVRVYVEWAFNLWYSKLLAARDLYDKVKGAPRTTKFVCFEGLTNPSIRQTKQQEVIDWLYPYQPPPQFQALASLTEQDEYKGSHATSKDPQLRSRLRKLVQLYDRKLLNGSIASSETIFGCNLHSLG